MYGTLKVYKMITMFKNYILKKHKQTNSWANFSIILLNFLHGDYDKCLYSISFVK